ncbi:MAG: TIGR00341 family protein [Flavipsychrobacter sp.]|nr:TIGR00341 family protein [Flavipsychrobacter sp.]
MKQIAWAIKRFLQDRFSLSEDRGEEQVIIESIRRDANFRGTNVWTLIFAIFIASIGLNVNSTAVIIGAMLISPLMGPIMAIGLSIGINDFELLKKGAKNLLIAAGISIATSSLYFLVTPLHEASSELLARTNPTVWDVFIAFLGGLAGIVAGTRREKSNVIPGVAIATALMPPLCTAGFGLATGQWLYFLGALYLFFINSLFICLATLLIVKRLRFHKVEFTSPEREKRVSRYILIIVTLTILPSIYLAYRIVQKTIFEENARKYVHAEFHFPKTQVVTRNYIFDGNQRTIELLLVGYPLEDWQIDSLRSRLPEYNLQDARLVVHQGLDAKQKIDLSAIKASVLEEVYANGQKSDSIEQRRPPEAIELLGELKALYPSITTYALSEAVFNRADTTVQDTLTLFVGRFSAPVSAVQKQQLAAWLKQRTQSDSVKIIVE